MLGCNLQVVKSMGSAMLSKIILKFFKHMPD
ncbi:MAG: hypothetical protein JWM59_1144 [Verrucomicrobiales bacterium]|nr:hypothetical protein [Verrucomicrobiales bacterium]